VPSIALERRAALHHCGTVRQRQSRPRPQIPRAICAQSRTVRLLGKLQYVASNGVGEPCDSTVVAATMSQLSLKAINTANFLVNSDPRGCSNDSDPQACLADEGNLSLRGRSRSRAMGGPRICMQGRRLRKGPVGTSDPCFDSGGYQPSCRPAAPQP